VNGLEHVMLFLVSLMANLFSAFSGGRRRSDSVAGADLPWPSLCRGAGDSQSRQCCLGYRRDHTPLERGTAGASSGDACSGFRLAGRHRRGERDPERAAEMALGLLTAGLGIYSWLNPQLGQSVVRMHSDRRGVLVGGLVLFGIYVLNGSLTSGTGLFVTMWQVRWFGLDYRRAIACTLILG